MFSHWHSLPWTALTWDLTHHELPRENSQCVCVCWTKVPPKEKIFYKSQASPICYGFSCSGERQLPGNSSVSVEVIPRWVIWSYAARNKGREEKSREKNLIAPAIKRSNLQQCPDTSPVTLDCNVFQSHRQMMWHMVSLTFFSGFLLF